MRGSAIEYLSAMLDDKPTVNGLLGPFGSGKTTLGVMLAVEKAKKRLVAGMPPLQSVVFTVGQRGDELARLGWSHAARLPRDFHPKMLGTEPFAKHYEELRHADLADANGVVLSEQARAQAVRPVMESVRFVDWSGSIAFQTHSAPAGLMESELTRLSQDAPIGLVVVDYVGILVDRFSQHLHWPPKRTSSRIRQVVERSRNIALRFNCPVWLIHQLSSMANGRAPATRQHDRDAMGCRHFGDGLDSCFALGTSDGLGYKILQRTKPSDQLPEEYVLKFDADFATLIIAAGARVSTNRSEIISDGNGNLKYDQATLKRISRLPLANQGDII